MIITICVVFENCQRQTRCLKFDDDANILFDICGKMGTFFEITN